MKSPLTLLKSVLTVASVAAISSAVSAAPASAFTFSNITTEKTSELVGDAFVNNFGFNVTDRGNNSVLFSIFNNNTTDASMNIASVFFDLGSNNNLLRNMSLNISNIVKPGGSVNFVNDTTGAMPQSNKIDPDWSTDFSTTRRNQGGAINGVNGGETLGISFTGNYNNVISALNAGTLRLGLHVRGIGPTDGSDAFVSGGSTENVPEPLTMLAAGVAVGFGTMFKKQRDRAQKAAE
ncbi:MAG: PEP-CTERM sorting domain-containing protein [Oscillatoriaceae cyanobacterium Prado104]|nr:PEP-CTERM sorting domain-containing protein [Oscillatoriaceae cyanobacterium Prado104]